MKSSTGLMVVVAGILAAGCGTTGKKAPESGEISPVKESAQAASASPYRTVQSAAPVQPKEVQPVKQVSLPPSPPALSVKIEDIRVGTGMEAKSGDTVFVRYTGWRADNRACFDSTQFRDPFKFVLGAGQVIKGWDQGVVGMKVGGKRTLTIPAELGYGEKGAGLIPPNADLLFEVELVNVLR